MLHDNTFYVQTHDLRHKQTIKKDHARGDGDYVIDVFREYLFDSFDCQKKLWSLNSKSTSIKLP